MDIIKESGIYYMIKYQLKEILYNHNKNKEKKV